MSNSERFKSVLSAILGIDQSEVTDNLSAEMVDTWDSLNHINLIGALEQEFGITLTTEQLGDDPSVPRLKALLAAQGIAL